MEITDGELLIEVPLNKTVQSIMYYVFSTKILQDGQLVELFFKKGGLEFVVKMRDKYTNRVSKNSSLKVNFFTNIFQVF